MGKNLIYDYDSVQISVIILFFFIHNVLNSGEISGIFFDLIFNLNFWFTFLLTVCICMIPFYIMRRIEFFSADNFIHNLKQKNYEDDFKKKYLVKGLQGMSKNLRYVVKFKKMLQGGEVDDDNYANKRVKQLVEQFQSTRKIKGNKKKELKRVEKEIPIFSRRSGSSINLRYDAAVVLSNADKNSIDPSAFNMIERKYSKSNLNENQKKEKAEINVEYHMRDR
jgi:hypothetical protein